MRHDRGPATVDEVVEELRELRAAAGEPSYARIVSLIAQARTERGVAAEVASPGRTTVYDVFRTGRSRLDADLVAEVVTALGVGPDEAEAWRERSRRARPAGEVEDGTTDARRIGWVLGGIGINVAGRGLVAAVGLPVHLDMIGTAVVAMGIGPWWGALVGVVSNLVGVLFTGASSIPFALVNVAGALVWGYGLRRGWGRTFGRFFALNLAAGAACTVVAAPILLALFGGLSGHGADGVTENILATTGNLAAAVVSSNLMISIIDKLVSGFTAAALVTISGLAGARLLFSGPR